MICSYTDDNGVLWLWCGTCGFWFPVSEKSSHKGHTYWDRPQ